MKKETGSYPSSLLSKKRLNLPVNPEVMIVLSDNFEQIKDRLTSDYDETKCYSGLTIYDVLISTFEYVIRERCLTKSSKEQIIDHFIFIFKKIMFRTINNYRLERKILNANYTSTEKKQPES